MEEKNHPPNGERGGRRFRSSVLYIRKDCASHVTNFLFFTLPFSAKLLLHHVDDH